MFTPAEPQLYRLNPHAWLIMELADGHTEAELTELYRGRTVPPLSSVVADRHLRECVEMLTGRGILERDQGDSENRP